MLVALGMMAPQTGRADIIVAEDFGYADGAVGGGEENGGIGWAGAWASSSMNSPANEFNIAGGRHFTGNGANQEVITHDRALDSGITVGTLDTLTIDFDLIIGPPTGNGRGIGVNFLNSGGAVFTLGKGINGVSGSFDGLATSSTQLSDATITQGAGTTYISATLTYDGSRHRPEPHRRATTLSANLAGTQVDHRRHPAYRIPFGHYRQRGG